MLRVVCFLSFALNHSKDPSVNLLVIIVVSMIVTAYFSYIMVYKIWLNSIIELFFSLNLGLLSFTTFYQITNDGDRTVTTYLSVSFSLFVFAVIIIYHVFQRLLLIPFLKPCIVSVLKLPSNAKEESELSQTGQNQLQDATAWVTHTSIELTRPLIQSQDHAPDSVQSETL